MSALRKLLVTCASTLLATTAFGSWPPQHELLADDSVVEEKLDGVSQLIGPPQGGGDMVTVRQYLESMIVDLRREAAGNMQSISARLATLADIISRHIDQYDRRTDLLATKDIEIDRHLTIVDGVAVQAAKDVDRMQNEMDHHVDEDTQARAAAARELQDIERRFAVVEANTQRLTDLTNIVERNGNRIGQLEAGGSRQAQEALAAIAALNARVTIAEGERRGIALSWQVVVAVLGLSITLGGVAGAYAARRHAATAKR